jgi:hypothetical protein
MISMIFHRNSEVYRYLLLREKLLTAILMRVFFGYSLLLLMICKSGIISVIFMEKGFYSLTDCKKIMY